VDPTGDKINSLSRDIIALDKRLSYAFETRQPFYTKKEILLQLRELRSELDRLKKEKEADDSARAQ